MLTDLLASEIKPRYFKYFIYDSARSRMHREAIELDGSRLT